MPRYEVLEWVAMILVIVLWWPPLFMGWFPDWYRVSLYALSALTVLVVFVRRLRRVNEGLAMSEQMMQTRFAAEEKVRGGKPSLDEKAPPDVTGELPLMPPEGTQADAPRAGKGRRNRRSPEEKG